MKILALDTATEACSAALLIDGRIIAREVETERGHGERILSMVDEVLTEGGLALAALDAIAFGRGPGGFTGVRLAASVTQGLAFAVERPVVPVSDLAAVAQRVLDLEPGIDRVIVCNDARMHEVYWACFERDPAGFAALVGDERVGAPGTVEISPRWRASASATSGVPSSGALAAGDSSGALRDAAPRAASLDLSSEAGGSALPGARAGAIGVAGRGFRAYPELRSKLLSSSETRGSETSNTPSPGVILVSDQLLPRAQDIARLAAVEVAAGRTRPAEDAIPVYLRDDVARPQPSRN